MSVEQAPDAIGHRWPAARRLIAATGLQRGAVLGVPHRGRLARAVGWNAAGTVLARLLTLASSIIVGRALGVAGFGSIGVMQQTVNLLVTVTALGLPTTLTTDLAAARVRDPQRVGALVAAALLASGVISVIVATVVAFGGATMASQVMGVPSLATALPGAAVLLVAQAIFGMQLGALGGLERFRSVAAATVVSGLGALCGAGLGARTNGVTGAIWGLAIGALASTLITQVMLAQACLSLKTSISLRDVRASILHLSHTARAATTTNLLVVGTTWAVSIALAHQPDGAVAAGLMAVGMQWRAAVLALPLTASTPLLSILSTLRDDHSARRSIGLLACVVAGGLAILGAVAVGVASPWLVRAYGHGFADAIPVMLLLVTSAIPLAVAGMLGQLTLGRGDRRTGVIACAAWSVTLLALSALLIPRFGAVGAAAATLLAAPVQVAILWKRNAEHAT